jgi:membrane-bound inhibitor of C-type lysozyme
MADGIKKQEQALRLEQQGLSMTRNLTAIAGVMMCVGLAACSTPKDARELSQKTVEYGCGPGANQPLTVQYTFQGEEALAAKVIYQNQTVDLTRATTSNADMVGNTFRGSGYTWTTEKFTRENAGQVNGNMLTQDAQQTATGTASSVGNVLVKDCKAQSVSS